MRPRVLALCGSKYDKRVFRELSVILKRLKTPRTLNNGNRTEMSPVRSVISVIIRVINKIRGRPICLITSMDDTRFCF